MEKIIKIVVGIIVSVMLIGGILLMSAAVELILNIIY